ncbi:MAG: alkaline phosphatase family protein [bacterium]
MSDIVTQIIADGRMELQPSLGDGTGLEYTFRTNFRPSADIGGAAKRIVVTVRQVESPNPMPIEVVIVKPGTSTEVKLDQPDLENTPGTIAAVNVGTGPIPAFGDDVGVVIGDTGPGGHAPPVIDDRWKYTIKENDPDGVWSLRIRNKGGNTENFDIQIRHPDMQLSLSESSVPFSLLNRFLGKVKTLVGLEVNLDRDVTVRFSQEFKHIAGLEDVVRPLGKVAEIPVSGNDIFLQDISLRIPELRLVPLGQDAVSLPLHFEFETDGPTEIEITNSPNLDITKLSLDVDFRFKGFNVYVEERDLAGTVVGTRPAVGLTSVGFDSSVVVPGLNAIENVVRDAVTGTIGGLLGGVEMIETLAGVSVHLTEALMFLAVGGEDRQFFDLRTTPSEIIVRHYRRPTARMRRMQENAAEIDGTAPTVATAFMATETPAGIPAPAVPAFNLKATAFQQAFGGGATTLAPTDDIRPDSPQKIEHIVVLMLENRSFDHMLGYLTSKKGRTDVDGLGAPANHTNPIPGSTQTKSVFRLEDGKAITIDPGHGVSAVSEQVASGQMSGFLSNYMKKSAFTSTPGAAEVVMGFYDDDNLEVFDQLADQFMVCDRWFCSHPGPTYPNRFISVMGSTPDINNLDLVTGGAGAIKGTNIFDLLTEGGVSWNYVESNIAFLRMFDRYRVDEQNIVQRAAWLEKARSGQLPAVSWIDPHIGNLEIDDQADDDHPPANVVRGQEGVHEIYEALTADQEQWNKTLFVVTYDEHGGFYDHVVPHGLDGGTSPIVHKIHEDGASHYGPRVPTFLVSPWVQKRSVSKTVFDHTSILKTIMVNFLGEESSTRGLLGARVDAANSLLDVLLDTRRPDTPQLQVPAPAPNAQPGDVVVPIDRSSFHLAMRLFAFGPKFRQMVADRE